MRLAAFLFAVVLAASSCAAAGTEPPWAGLRQERAGWTLRIVQVERQPGIELGSILGQKAGTITGTVPPPPGQEYFIVTLGGESAEGTPQIDFTQIALVDSAGQRHDSMLTQFGLNAAKKEARIPTPVPLGSDIRSLELGDLHWPLAPDAPAPPPGK